MSLRSRSICVEAKCAISHSPFRLPPPLMQTTVQLEFAAKYWSTHSIGWNNPNNQTRAEAAASAFWQAHPGNWEIGQNGQTVYVLSVNQTSRETAAAASRPAGNCLQVAGRLPSDSPCCTQISPCNLCVGPCVVVSSGCPADACVWGGDSFNNHPFAQRIGGASCAGEPEGCTVGVFKGSPAGKCDDGAYAVNQNIAGVGGVPRSVKDVNEVFQGDGLPFSAPGGILAINQHVWGWIYEDNANQFWTQINPAFSWTASFAASINAWGASLGIALNAPTGTSPKGPFAKAPPVPQGQKYFQCWSMGSQFG